jgi:hypothetical protein
MSKSLVSVNDLNFDVVKEYLNNGASKTLSAEHQRMVDICLDVYQMLKKYPQRNICINRLRVQQGLTYPTAAKYVDFARATWGNYVDLKREFLETFFLEKLLQEISDPDASEAAKAKNLATLQKHLEAMPEQQVDPKLMEKNTVYIQVNIGGRSVPLSEEDLEQIPMAVRQKLLASLGGNIDDQEAVRLLES